MIGTSSTTRLRIHEKDTTVKCTYIEIPQVQEIYGVLLSKPFWIWGCEMGANECGVAIGNALWEVEGQPERRGRGLQPAGGQPVARRYALEGPAGDHERGPLSACL